jgi:hypothetical protein
MSMRTVPVPVVVVLVVVIVAVIGCEAEQRCDDTIAEIEQRTDAITVAHNGPCESVADCEYFTRDVRCDDAARAAFDDDRVAIGVCPLGAVAVARVDEAQAALDQFTADLCARPLEACTNGDSQCGGELACRDGACVMDF